MACNDLLGSVGEDLIDRNNDTPAGQQQLHSCSSCISVDLNQAFDKKHLEMMLKELLSRPPSECPSTLHSTCLNALKHTKPDTDSISRSDGAPLTSRAGMNSNRVDSQCQKYSRHLESTQLDGLTSQLSMAETSGHKIPAADCLEKKKLKYYIIVSFVFVIQVLLTSVFVVALVRFHVIGVEELASKDQRKICMLCSVTSHDTNALDGDVKFRKESNDESVCCSQDQLALQKLFEEYVRKEFLKELQNLTERGWSNRPPKPKNRLRLQSSRIQCAAHLFLHPKSQHGILPDDHQHVNSSDYRDVVGWVESGETAYRRSCIGYDPTNGQFLVSRSGWYVVYSHLAFVGRSDPTWGSRQPQEESIIYGQRIHNGKRVLHVDARGVAVNSGPQWIDVPVHSSFVVFSTKLRKDEVLSVEAKPAELLHRVNGASYFGLFRLGVV